MAGSYASATKNTLSSHHWSLPPLCFLPIHLCQILVVIIAFYATAFIFMNREQRDEPGAGSHLVILQLNNVNLQPHIVARCWICFRKPLCKFLSSSAMNLNERAYSHCLQGTTQYNEMMRQYSTIYRKHSQVSDFEVCSVIVFYHLFMQLNIKREINVPVMWMEMCWFVLSNHPLNEQCMSVWYKCLDDSVCV